MLNRLVFSMVIVLIGLPLIAGATTYDISGDFSNTNNPNGVWSYGRLDVLDGTFTAYSNSFSLTSGGATIDVWNDPSYLSLGAPTVWNNVSGQAFVSSTVYYLTGWAGFHPGPDFLGNALSDFRFTAPVTGMYSLLADFQGADVVGPTTTDVFVHVSGNNLYSAYIMGYGDSSRQSYSGSVFLNAGQYLDFAVSNHDGSFYFDSTAIRASISVVPEPGILLLLGSGLVGLIAGMRMFKRQDG